MIDRVTTPTTLTTERLILRPWRESDLEPFAALNADPQVMRFFPNRLDRDASDAMARRLGARVDENGWGLWAAEVKDLAPFIGFIGLQPIPFDAHFTPAVEVGWRLAKRGWRKGYATEAATAVVAFGFGELGLDEIVSFTFVGNERSRGVMERLGMTHDPADDFDHPLLPEGDPLRHHVLYRLATKSR